MPLDTGDREWIQREIRKSREQDRQRRGLPWLRDWILVVAGTVVVAGAIVTTVVMTNFAMNARRQVADTRTVNEERAGNLDRELDFVSVQLASNIVASEAARADFPDRLLDLLQQNASDARQNRGPVLSTEIAAARVRKARELSIPADATRIAGIGRDFLRLLKTERLRIPVMQVAQELIGYRSTLLPNPFGEPDRTLVAHSAMRALPQFLSFKALTSKSGIWGYPKTDQGVGVSVLNVLARPESMLTEPFQAVLVEGYEAKLDGLNARNCIFSGCRIHYEGGKLKLENVYFQNCTFTLDQSASDFARAALDNSPAMLLNQQ